MVLLGWEREMIHDGKAICIRPPQTTREEWVWMYGEPRHNIVNLPEGAVRCWESAVKGVWEAEIEDVVNYPFPTFTYKVV